MPSSTPRTLDSLANYLPDGFSALALESIKTPAGLFTRDLKILWMNNAMGLVHRCKPKDAIGKHCYKALKNCSTVCEDCCMTEVLKTGRTLVQETWVDLPNGKRRWGDLHTYPVRGDDHSVDVIFCIAFDTTHHVLKEQERHQKAIADIPLSPRETEVLRLMAEGYTNTQISSVLDISSHTVKTYVNGVFNKLGVNDRTLAAVKGVRHNLI